MEPWAPQWPSPALRPERGLRRGAYYRPQSWHDGEKFCPRQDLRGSPQTQPDARATPQHPASVPRRREWFPPVPGADYYDASYTGHLYPQPSLETMYQSYGSLSREDYAYNGYYHQGHHPGATGEKSAGQGSPFSWRKDPHDHTRITEQSGTSGIRSDTHLPQGWDPSWGSPDPGRPGHLPAESLCAGPQGETSLPSESNLLAQQESGLSSSGFELSQYMEDATEMRGSAVASVWSAVQAEEVSAAEPQSPMKFYVPHTPLSFGPGGQLVLGCPHMPRDGQTAVVELHSMEVLLNDSEEQEEMRIFAGPLIREDVHKVDIMTFCQQKVAQSSKADTLQSPDSALLWKLLVLLCRQNGSMVGSDIAELLMEDCKKLDQYKPQPSVANLISLGDEDWPVLSSGTPNLLTGEIPPSVETPSQAVEKFTKLLYFGRKKEALEWAIKNHLWGHALFLSSKMDPRTYSWVMSSFTSTLVLNDPLQTLFQLMSGRIPQAATCCGDRHWGDWRPHLAVMLSNQGGDPELHQRAIITMGDTLASKGLVEAAHFCYLMAQVPFGHYTVKTDYLALLGSSHSQAFLKFATTEAIQRTEIFEYCRVLGRPQSFLPSFQVYKLLYAARLADHGLASQALHYCEAISRAMLCPGVEEHPVLLAELIKLAERLKLLDPLLSERRSGDRESEPDWLVQLRRQQEALQPKGARDAGHLHSAHPSGLGVGRAGTGSYMDELRNSPSSDSQGLGGHPGAARDSSAPRPPLQQPGQSWPSTQQPFLPGSSPVEGDAAPVEAPVPLYPVPQAPVPASWDSGALPEASAGLGLAEAALTPGEPAPPEPFQPLYVVQVPPSTQVTSSPKAPGFLESPAKEEQGKEEEEDEKEEEDEEEKSLPNSAAREKQGDGKGNPKGSGFSWFSWFRSKPSSSSSSGDEDSSRSDSEETPGAQSGPLANPGPSLLPATESQPPMGISTLAGSTGEAPGALSGGGAARVTGSGGPPELAASPPELSFTPGFLLPPPSFQGGVPLYNPTQVPQLSPRTGQNRPNRLAQRRYPAQPAQL